MLDQSYRTSNPNVAAFLLYSGISPHRVSLDAFSGHRVWEYNSADLSATLEDFKMRRSHVAVIIGDFLDSRKLALSMPVGTAGDDHVR